MLGKLFNLGAGTGALPAAHTPSPRSFPLDSVQEDIHTRHLLFPDPQDLYEHRPNQLYPLSSGATTPTGSSSNAFDYNADVELDVRDVRIIIMQDALSSVAASLLYDSQPPPPVPTGSVDRPSATAGSYSVQEPRRTFASARKPSLSHAQRPIAIQSGNPRTRQGAFDRRPSVHSRNQAYTESEPQRLWREYREELATFSSCIFGNSELMAYKGTSTKVHVVPSDLRSAENLAMLGDGRASAGRSAARASRLSQSFTSENPPPFTTPPTPSGASRASDRRKVLITRLFPVSLPLGDDPALLHGASSDAFPSAADDPRTARRKFQPRQKRTPMYAVALIISLPPSPAHCTTASTLRSGFKGSGSYAEQDSFPSSFSSTRRSGWTLVGQGGFAPDSFETGFTSDMEDQIDAITQHWDVIMRTLSHLQSVVASTLYTMLRQADLASPDPLPALSLQTARSSSAPGRRSEDGPPVKPPKTSAKHITLLPNCLLDNRRISAEINAAKTRIVAGIRASRVTTGQNRWPIWREEARWVAKWAGGREQGFFFFNLLTRFLATHTDWLQALSPPAYRRRFLLQQKAKGEEDSLVPARTVIVSDNKIAARRLVFLLAAFLPASQQLPGIRAYHRPSTPGSLCPLSQSPPSFVIPILKEESLRRKINRRTGTRMSSSHSRNLSLQSPNPRAGAVPPPLAHLSMEGRHERRASDAASIRPSHLPLRGSDTITRKSSAATTATITPETSIPHFSTVHRAELFSQGRPSSSNSVAADDLKRLTRDESPGSQGSAAGERRQSSRWSVISGLWGTRRRDSTAKPPTSSDGQNGSSMPASTQQPAASVPSKETSGSGSAGKGASGDQPGDSRGSPATGPRDPTPPPRASADTFGLSEQAGVPQKIQRTPDPSGAFESPVKTSINMDDGVIDVDVPLPDFITSFESAVSSPSSSGYLSASGFGTGLDAFEQSGRFLNDGEVPLNVAGWLQHYHPDFVLQAVPAQHGLIEKVKASMRAEPTPPLPPGTEAAEDTTEKWVDVTSAVVADTTTFTITRIRYRRLVRLRPSLDQHLASPPTTTDANSSAPLAWANSPYDTHIKDEFIEEPVVNFDDVLVDAVERVIASGGTETVSKVSSASSSRSTSKRRERSNSVSTGSDARSQQNQPGLAAPAATPAPAQTQAQAHHGIHGALLMPQEVPRSQCKTVLLSALEDIIHDVIREREQEQENGQGAHGSGSVAATTAREKDSPLREAVRGWIESVELSGD